MRGIAWTYMRALVAVICGGTSSLHAQQSLPYPSVTQPGLQHAGERAYFDGDEGGRVHGDDATFDFIGPVYHRHETIDGFIIFEALNTDHAFIERKVRLDYRPTRGADAGEANEDELSGELFWALNSRMAVVVDAPLIWRNPEMEANATGVGDLEVGARFVAFNGERSILTFGLNVDTPTGNADRGLGAGHTALEPLVLWWWDWGRGTVLQSDVRIGVPVGVNDPEDELIYNFALLHTIRGSGDWRFFPWLTPLVELNGSTMLNGTESGSTVVNVTPGFRWAVSEENHAGIGVSFPITGAREFDAQYIFSFIHHF